jgi:hypothetical protein
MEIEHGRRVRSHRRQTLRERLLRERERYRIGPGIPTGELRPLLAVQAANKEGGHSPIGVMHCNVLLQRAKVGLSGKTEGAGTGAAPRWRGSKTPLSSQPVALASSVAASPLPH